jgi:hypothetical protein
MNNFLKKVIKEGVEVIMEEVNLDKVVSELTGEDWTALAFKKNDLQIIDNREDVLKTMKTMAYWVSL